MTVEAIVYGVLTVIALIFVLPILFSCIFLVSPREARLVQSWTGASVTRTITEAGLYFKFPWPFQSVSKPIDLSQRMLTVDNRARSSEEAFFNLEVKAVMEISPKKVKEAIFNMNSPTEQIKASMSEAVKRVVPSMTLDEVYTDRERIEREVKTSLNDVYAEHGWTCLKVIVEDPRLETSMEEASNKRIENRRRAEAAEDLSKAIFLEETALAKAASESLRLRTRAAGEAKKAFTEEMVSAITQFRKALPDLSPELLLQAMSDLDRRDSIITASGNPGSTIVIDTASDRGQSYADMAAFMKNVGTQESA